MSEKIEKGIRQCIIAFIVLFLLFVWGCIFISFVQKDIDEATVLGPPPLPAYCRETEDVVDCRRVGVKKNYGRKSVYLNVGNY